MPTLQRLAAMALAIAIVMPPAAAMDESAGPIGKGPTLLGLCGDGDAPLGPAYCKDAGFDALPGKIERALQATLAKAPAHARALLKRDQVWFDEILLNAAESVPLSGDSDEQEAFAANLRQRAATLETIAAGFGRPGISGRWVNAFGGVEVTPADGGAYRIAIDIRAVYGTDDDRHSKCEASALLHADSGGWLSGRLVAKEPTPSAGLDAATASAARPPSIKIRRQGETLRVVVADAKDFGDPKLTGCNAGQITASYFASGKTDAAMPAVDHAFVAPSFDCAHPASATDEEICADPELADNDQKLNRAWKALLPRLDPTTRRALIEDQRGYVRAQTDQYLEFLHPAWHKTTYFIHFTSEARDKVFRLQRERIALLEGFDDSRRGFAGVWLAHNAILNVIAEEDGSLTAKGWKWEQGDWKAGCDYDIAGKVSNGVFQSDETGKNPDTLERDHATLIVNRKDDVFAAQRISSDNKREADEPKCKRLLSNSSTARLFPARPSPDINDFDSIR